MFLLPIGLNKKDVRIRDEFMRIFLSIVLALFVSYSLFSQEAQKVDELPNSSCADITIRSSHFFDEIKKREDSKGYIIVYNGKLLKPLYNKENKSIQPHFDEAKAEINNIKSRINFFKFDAKKLVFVEGGLRENFTIEFWIVPNNANSPNLTPTLKKMKFRKGKPKGFCVICC